MDITMFVAHMNVGGAQRVCISLANEFVRCGNAVTIIVLDLERDNDINTHMLDDRCRLVSLGAGRIRYAILPMLKYLRKNKPEFLLIFGNEMSVFLNKLKKAHLIKTKLIQRVLNNLNITLDKEDHVSPIVEKYLKKAQGNLKNMDHLISQCKGMEEMLVEGGFSERENISTIYNPVSQDVISKTDAIRVPFSARGKDRTKEVVFVGRIDPQKNLTHLVKAFAKVKEKRPNTILRLVGNGNSVETIQRLVQEMELQNDVFVEGVTSQIEKVYAAADVVALSSEYEGMPNCLIEAIGCGIPIVSYDCKLGPSEIIVEDVNGYLVPYFDIDALAEKLTQALDKDWNENDIKKTCEKFDVEHVAKQYIEVFQKIAGSN